MIIFWQDIFVHINIMITIIARIFKNDHCKRRKKITAISLKMWTTLKRTFLVFINQHYIAKCTVNCFRSILVRCIFFFATWMNEQARF
jgi:hypothetical protein